MLDVAQCINVKEEKVIEMLEKELKLSINTGEIVVPLLGQLMSFRKQIESITTARSTSYGLIRIKNDTLFIRPDYMKNASNLLQKIAQEKEYYGRKKKKNVTV